MQCLPARSCTISWAAMQCLANPPQRSHEAIPLTRWSQNPAHPEWLEKLWWREACLTLEAARPANLPPCFGSTLRGALGHLLRAALCEASGCRHECQRSDVCRYYSLFEQHRPAAKRFLLLAPSPPALEEIAMGGPVNLPYRTGAPRGDEALPVTRRLISAWPRAPIPSLPSLGSAPDTCACTPSMYFPRFPQSLPRRFPRRGPLTSPPTTGHSLPRLLPALRAWAPLHLPATIQSP
jgi:hypothetical protein